MKKQFLLLVTILAAVWLIGNFPQVPPLATASSIAGATVGEADLPFPAVRNGVTTTTPYLFLERWGDAGATGTCYNTATGAATTTYGDACIRYAQNSTTGTWYVTMPSLLPSGSYLAWPRSGADGSEANTDTNLAPPQVIEWDQRTQSLKIVHQNILVGY